MLGVVSSTLPFAETFLKPSMSILYRNARNSKFVLKMKTSTKTDRHVDYVPYERHNSRLIKKKTKTTVNPPSLDLFACFAMQAKSYSCPTNVTRVGNAWNALLFIHKK